MNDRIKDMIAFLGRQIIRMRREGRKPESNIGAELIEALSQRWPDIKPSEIANVMVGLGEAMQRAERTARPANDRGGA